MNIAIPDRYLLAPDFQQRAIDFQFPAGIWSVAAALAETNKATSPFELEALTGLDSAQVHEALERLYAKKLVRRNLISWKEFNAARAKARSTAKATPVAAAPSGKQVMPTLAIGTKPTQAKADEPAQSSTSNGHLPTQENVAARLGTITPQQTTARPTNAWVWQKPDPAQVAASKPVIPDALPNGEQPNGRLLRPLLAQIENLKGGGVEGQLLVYQVFLRVPYQLLYDEGIKSLHFVDDRTVIQNPALHDAIVKAAKVVTGVDLA